ncbi:LysR family transcriptional regulator [Actinomadura sp. 21ATH]|uniref:LysR family transcriptional regulator n=1 Tax=Actinomadura sp. 21ATH TaxID=1735444 RepID=UPI0035C08253
MCMTDAPSVPSPAIRRSDGLFPLIAIQPIALPSPRKQVRCAELITKAHDPERRKAALPAERTPTYARLRAVATRERSPAAVGRPSARTNRTGSAERAMTSPGGCRLELRQLRYFVTVADELHFGRAAAREHIVQSALSQQVQRLERELGVRLLERSTHHVALTTAGAAFLVEARQILAHVDRAARVARTAGSTSPALRVGIIDAGYDSMPQLLHQVQARYPDLVIHQIEAGVPEQYQLLADGRLDVGIGRAALAPPQIASQLFRLDPLGILLPRGHRLADLEAVPVATLAEEPLLLAEDARAPEFNQFTIELCRSAGFTPTVYEGTVESTRAAAALVAQGRCLYCVPSSCTSALPGTLWRPLTGPASFYPWSVLWRAGNESDHVTAIVDCARAMAAHFGWLTGTEPSSAGHTGTGRSGSHRLR